MKTSPEAFELIKKWEGYVGTAKDDGFGNITVGYGHTSAAGPPAVTQGLTVTPQRAEEILHNDLARVEKAVDDLVKVELSQSEFDALVSFQFNTGGLGRSTLLRDLNNEQYDEVPAELARWTYSNGQDVPGLHTRRANEIKLWNKEKAVPVEPSPAATPVVQDVLLGLSLAQWTKVVQADPALFVALQKLTPEALDLFTKINTILAR